jgi:hypothetical protein
MTALSNEFPRRFSVRVAGTPARSCLMLVEIVKRKLLAGSLVDEPWARRKVKLARIIRRASSACRDWTTARISYPNSVLRAPAFLDPLIDCRFLEPKVAAELEVRNLALLYKPVHRAQVTMEIVSDHPGGQNVVIGVAPVFSHRIRWPSFISCFF